VCCDYALKMALTRLDAETLDELEALTTSEYRVNISWNCLFNYLFVWVGVLRLRPEDGADQAGRGDAG
jgi:hypothetical protein